MNFLLPHSLHREHVCLSSWERLRWTWGRKGSAPISPLSSLLCTESWTAHTQIKVTASAGRKNPGKHTLFVRGLTCHMWKWNHPHTLLHLWPTVLSLSRPHAEEPGTGADWAAEETSRTGEILTSLLRCAKGVFSEASSTQTTQSHAGMTEPKHIQ